MQSKNKAARVGAGGRKATNKAAKHGDDLARPDLAAAAADALLLGDNEREEEEKEKEEEDEENARIAQKYNVPHEIEHILKQSDMYIGDDMKPSTVHRWLPETDDLATAKLVFRPCTMVHGVMKLIDELVVNASDQAARTAQAIKDWRAAKTSGPCPFRPVRNIYVSADETTGAIEVHNDGTGIEVVMHPTENKWVPEVVFTKLRAGENGDKSESSTTGGKNGHGAKLALIWSTASTIETVDETRQLRYLQHIGPNMFTVHPPEVSKVPKTEKPFTRVRIVPDYARANMPLGMQTPDFLALIRARVLCLAAVVSDKRYQVKVYYNGALVPIAGMAGFVARFPLPRPPCVDEEDENEDEEDEQMLPEGEEEGESSLQNEEEEEEDASSRRTMATASSSSSSSLAGKKRKRTSATTTTPLPRWIQYASPNPRWEVFVGYSSSGKKEHVSFANGVCTYQGGTHVAHIVDQITARAVARIASVHKVTLKPSAVSSLLQVFVRADIAIPKFSGQAKESLRTADDAFGGTCNLTNAWIDRLVAALGIGAVAVARESALEARQLKKDLGAVIGGTGGGGASGSLRKYQLAMQAVDPKYQGAAAAGRYTGSSAAERAKTELMLTEGDSAKAAVISGISPDEAKYIGVYPLSGVPANALKTPLKALVAKSLAKKRTANSADASSSSSDKKNQSTKNDPLLTVMSIMGLEVGMVFTDMASVVRQLHYAHMVFVADQDHDGSHIKGLMLLFVHTNWPTLLRVPGFLRVFNTPVVVVRRKRDGVVLRRFMSQTAFDRWKLSEEARSVSWVAKYYKGLGTSTPAEWRFYMAHRDEFTFTYTGKESDELMSVCFHDKRTADRKRYLTALAAGPEARELEPENGAVTVEVFLGDMLRTYSNYSNLRALPHVVDGFKPSMRKVWFASRLRGLTQDIKVAQLAGFISEKADYHHGEASMQNTIIGMAQRIPGQNNIALMQPSGQFGTRLENGGDAASPRYTFTHMAPIACTIFRAEDDCVLPGLPASDDVGTIEPAHYVPILPMALINPCGGVGTGWSHTSVVYHPAQIADHIRVHFLQTTPTLAHLYSNGGVDGDHNDDGVRGSADDLVPYYEGFQGTIRRMVGGGGAGTDKDDDKTAFVMRGVYTAALVDDVDHRNQNADCDQFLRVVVTEVPVEQSYQQYKAMMLNLQMPQTEEDVKKGKKREWVLRLVDDTINNTACHLVLEIEPRKGGPDKLQKLLTARANDAAPATALEKFLKLATVLHTTNMSLVEDPVDPATGLYSEHAVVLPHTHKGPATILARHCEERMATYVRRQASHLATLRRRLVVEENMARFLAAVYTGELVFQRLSRAQMVALLVEHGYATSSDNSKAAEDDAGEDATAGIGSYNYLLSVRMHQCSMENVAKRTRAVAELRAEVEAYALETPRSLWLKELAEFDVAYEAYLGELEEELKELRHVHLPLQPDTSATGGGGASKKRKSSTEKPDESSSGKKRKSSTEKPDGDSSGKKRKSTTKKPDGDSSSSPTSGKKRKSTTKKPDGDDSTSGKKRKSTTMTEK